MANVDKGRSKWEDNSQGKNSLSVVTVSCERKLLESECFVCVLQKWVLFCVTNADMCSGIRNSRGCDFNQLEICAKLLCFQYLSAVYRSIIFCAVP